MRGLTWSQLRSITAGKPEVGQPMAVYLREARRCSLSGYSKYSASRGFWVLYMLCILSCLAGFFLESVSGWEGLIVTSIFVCWLTCPILGLAGVLFADTIVSISVRRLRAGKCSVCGYTLADDLTPEYIQRPAARVRCPECGKWSAVGVVSEQESEIAPTRPTAAVGVAADHAG